MTTTRAALQALFLALAVGGPGCVSTGETNVSTNQGDAGTKFTDRPCGKFCNRLLTAGCAVSPDCEVRCGQNVSASPQCDKQWTAFMSCTVEREKPKCAEDGTFVTDVCVPEGAALADCGAVSVGTSCTPADSSTCGKCLAAKCCNTSSVCLQETACSADVDGWATCLGTAKDKVSREACGAAFAEKGLSNQYYYSCVYESCSACGW